MNVLVFAPHPDDDILGCGGSIIHHVRAGNGVCIVYITSGDAGSMTIPKETLAQTRQREAAQAAGILGVTDLEFLRIPDGYVRYSDTLLVQCTDMIRKKKPDIVYMPHADDFPSDHSQTAALVTEAIRRAGASAHQECAGDPWTVGTVLGYEVWTPVRQVGYTEDITDVMPQKLEALKKHASQLGSVRYDKAIEGLNAYRGILSERGQYCECFSVIRIKTV